MHHVDLDIGNPIVIHSKLKRRYDRYRRSMWAMKLLSAVCILAALVLAAWFAGEPNAGYSGDVAVVLVAAGVPVGLVVVMAAAARVADRGRR